jgi:hypothetical protein
MAERIPSVIVTYPLLNDGHRLFLALLEKELWYQNACANEDAILCFDFQHRAAGETLERSEIVMEDDMIQNLSYFHSWRI